MRILKYHFRILNIKITVENTTEGIALRAHAYPLSRAQTGAGDHRVDHRDEALIDLMQVGGRDAIPKLRTQRAESIPVMSKDVVDLFLGEPGELYDLGLRSVSRRQNTQGRLPIFQLDDHPRLMLPVLATIVRMRHEMRAALEQNPDGARTRDLFSLMWNFNKKSCHGLKSPFHRQVYYEAYHSTAMKWHVVPAMTKRCQTR